MFPYKLYFYFLPFWIESRKESARELSSDYIFLTGHVPTAQREVSVGHAAAFPCNIFKVFLFLFILFYKEEEEEEVDVCKNFFLERERENEREKSKNVHKRKRSGRNNGQLHPRRQAHLNGPSLPACWIYVYILNI